MARDSSHPINRTTLRKQLRASLALHSKKLSANDSTDLLIMLNYKLFLKDIMKEATQLAIKDGSRQIHGWHLEDAGKLVLRKYHG